MQSRQSFSIRSLYGILIAAILLTSPSISFADAQNETDTVKRQLETYAVLLAEEELAGERNEAYLDSASDRMSDLLKRYQAIVTTGTASSTSPISRKHFDTSIGDIDEDCSRLSSQLQDTFAEAILRNDFLQSFNGMSTAAASTSQYGVEILRETDVRVRRLTTQTQGQIAKIEGLQRQAKRLLGRMEKANSKEKQSLYDLWIQYLLVGKTPVFSVSFWDKPLPDARWLKLKQAEVRAGLGTIGDNTARLVILFLMLLGMGLAAKRLIKHFPDGLADENARNRVNRYYAVAVSGFSLVAATRVVFPAGMDSLAELAASIFLFGILKLAKHICKDPFLSTCGHSRLSFLFLLSTQLLIFHLPGRSTTLIFILIILTLWGNDTIHAWRNRGKQLTKTAMRGGSLAPLFMLSFFGYGRLACLLTIVWCLGIFVRAFGNIWAQSLFMETEKSTKLQKGLARSLLVPLGWAIALTVTYLWLVDFLGTNTLDSILQLHLSFGDYSLYLKDIVILTVLFFLTHNGIAAFRVSIEHIGSKWQRAKRGAVPSIQTLATYATWSLFTLLALRILGVSLTSITVIAGGLSVGIGFGLQNVVNNFISGLILLFGRSIQQGDVIEVGGLWCTVKKINIRTTLVETFESAVIMIPNSDLVTAQVTNWTKNNPTLRRDILVGVAYGSDTRKVETTLLKVAEAHPHVLKKPAPFILFNDFGASSLDFILRIWIDDIDNTIRAISELRFAIDDAFREADIEIAFPQMDVHFKTAPAFAGRPKPFGGD